MKAIVYTRYGPPDVLKLLDVARPIPKDDEVQIKVHTASVNGSDWEGLEGDRYMPALGDFENRFTRSRV